MVQSVFPFRKLAYFSLIFLTLTVPSNASGQTSPQAQLEQAKLRLEEAKQNAIASNAAKNKAAEKLDKAKTALDDCISAEGARGVDTCSDKKRSA